MAGENKPDPEEPTGASDKVSENVRRIARFAQYTAPVMLATLASPGKHMAAFAASLPP